MEILESQLNVNDAQFLENAAYHKSLADDLKKRLELIRQGGGEKYRKRHTEQGKLFVRERIDHLLDSGSPFMELSPLAAWDMYDSDAPSAGIVIGIGGLSGRECLMV